MQPLVVIIGETASGKSALALRLAAQFNGELICADSWTVYRDFDIGTAKPTAEERARVPHHLLDVADPRQGFSAVESQRLAQAAIEDITTRGKLPILVGGTGLYVDSVLFAYQFLPAPPPELRQELNELPLEAVLARAQAMGLDTVGIDTRNKRRVIRLIENNGVRPEKGKLRPRTLVLGLETDRGQLRDRITKRVDTMLAAGLEVEAGQLAERYGWDAEPMKGIGYREWQPYFEPGLLGSGNPAARQSLEQTRQRIISASMQLAKRQRTWFRKYHALQADNDCIHWLQAPNTERDAVAYTTTFIRQ